MKKQIQAVQLFHETFKAPIANEPTYWITPERYNLRHDLMKEENEEYLQAAKNGDLIEIADALGDMLYILCGTIIEHGLQHKIEQVFDEIQRSNMSKADENGNPIFREDGKILKGPNYFKPDIKSVLDRDYDIDRDYYKNPQKSQEDDLTPVLKALGQDDLNRGSMTSGQ